MKSNKIKWSVLLIDNEVILSKKRSKQNFIKNTDIIDSEILNSNGKVTFLSFSINEKFQNNSLAIIKYPIPIVNDKITIKNR